MSRPIDRHRFTRDLFEALLQHVRTIRDDAVDTEADQVVHPVLVVNGPGVDEETSAVGDGNHPDRADPVVDHQAARADAPGREDERAGREPTQRHAEPIADELDRDAARQMSGRESRRQVGNKRPQTAETQRVRARDDRSVGDGVMPDRAGQLALVAGRLHIKEKSRPVPDELQELVQGQQVLDPHPQRVESEPAEGDFRAVDQDVLVVPEDEDAVGGSLDIALDPVHPDLQRPLNRRTAVAGEVRARTAVADDLDRRSLGHGRVIRR